MHQSIGLAALLVRDYDEALQFFVGTLGFELIEDTFIPAQAKRWVVIRPAGGGAAAVLLARAASPEQTARIGNQTGGRVLWVDELTGLHARRDQRQRLQAAVDGHLEEFVRLALVGVGLRTRRVPGRFGIRELVGGLEGRVDHVGYRQQVNNQQGPGEQVVGADVQETL
jgi:catechol 2,3-dioxygenase-like lactoylglutathione lyase family enzyme